MVLIDRVLISKNESARPSIAESMGFVPTIYFMRRDGWVLAAPPEFEVAAYGFWTNEWVLFCRQDMVWTCISEYGRSDEAA